MDPTILTALIGAGAALLGGIIGTTGSIVTARVQHRLTMESQRRKEARARVIDAAEKCRTNIVKLARVTIDEQHARDDEEAFVARHNELRRLQDETAAEALYLPAEVQARV